MFATSSARSPRRKKTSRSARSRRLRGFRPSLADQSARTCSCETVSYTHLDVYKRQAQIVPQTQHFSNFAHGQTFLWHSGFSSGSRRKLKPVVQRRFLASDINNDPAMSISIRIRPASIAADIHITGIFIHIVRNPYSHPSGILIHIAPESLFTWSGICTVGDTSRHASAG